MVLFGCSLVSRLDSLVSADTSSAVADRDSSRRDMHCWLCRHLVMLELLSPGSLRSFLLAPSNPRAPRRFEFPSSFGCRLVCRLIDKKIVLKCGTFRDLNS